MVRYHNISYCFNDCFLLTMCNNNSRKGLNARNLLIKKRKTNLAVLLQEVLCE